MNSEEILREVIAREHERELSEIPDDEELRRTIHVSPEFHKKMRDLVRSHERRVKMRQIRRKAACIFFAILASALLLCGINEDVRATCLRWIQRLVDGGMTEYQVPSPGDEKEKSGAVAGFELGYVPDGFELESKKIKNDYGTYTYRNGSQKLVLQYRRGDGTRIFVDNERNVLSHAVLSDGTIADYYESYEGIGEYILIWKKDDYVIVLRTNSMDKEELVCMANSAK